MESMLLSPCLRYILRLKCSLQITPCIELLLRPADWVGVFPTTLTANYVQEEECLVLHISDLDFSKSSLVGKLSKILVPGFSAGRGNTASSSQLLCLS